MSIYRASLVIEKEAIHQISIKLTEIMLSVLPAKSFFLIGGPSGTAKSTITGALKPVLEQKTGRNVVVLKLDKYFKIKSERPLGPDGQPDLDNLQSLHLDWLKDDLKKLLAGEPIYPPRYYDSRKNMNGTSIRHSGEMIRLGKDAILIIESIFAFEPVVLDSLDAEACYKIFFDSPVDKRLINRIIREERPLEIKAIDTLRDWERIRKAEKKFGARNSKKADMVFYTEIPGYVSYVREELGTYLSGAEQEARRNNEEGILSTIENIRGVIETDRDFYEIQKNSEIGKECAGILERCSVSISEKIRGLFTFPLNGLLADRILKEDFSDQEILDLALIVFQLHEELGSKSQKTFLIYELMSVAQGIIKARFIKISSSDVLPDEKVVFTYIRWLSKFGSASNALGDNEMVRIILKLFQVFLEPLQRWRLINLLQEYVSKENSIFISLPTGYRVSFPFDLRWKEAVRKDLLQYFSIWCSLFFYYRSILLNYSNIEFLCDQGTFFRIFSFLETDLRKKNLLTTSGSGYPLNIKCGNLTRRLYFKEYMPRNHNLQSRWDETRKKGLVSWQSESVQVKDLNHPGYPLYLKYYFVRAPRRRHWRQRECLFCTFDPEVAPVLNEGYIDLFEEYGLPYRFCINGYPYFNQHWMAIDYLHRDSSVTTERLEELFLVSTLMDVELYLAEKGASHDEHCHPQIVKDGLDIPDALEEEWDRVSGFQVWRFRYFPGPSYIFRSKTLSVLAKQTENLRSIIKGMGMDISISIYPDRGMGFKAIVFPRTAKISKSTGMEMGTNELLGHVIVDKERFEKLGPEDILQSIKDVVPSQKTGNVIYEKWVQKTEIDEGIPENDE